jgi:fucose permease
MLAALWLAAVLLFFINQQNSPDMLLWVLVLLIQSVSYAASLIVSVVSVFPAIRFPAASSVNLQRLRI